MLGIFIFLKIICYLLQPFFFFASYKKIITMKTLLFFLFLSIFLVSCKQDDEDIIQKVNSYDVYVSGKENGQLCYWKNGIKHNIDNILLDSNPSKIYISGNDVYLKGRYGFWKNGSYTTYHQVANLTTQDRIDIFDFYVKNGNIYFVGITSSNINPATDKFEFCYWKNGIKFFLFKDTSAYNDNCTITEFNSDTYVGGEKKINGVLTQGYFKNTTFYPITINSQNQTKIISNDNNLYLSGQEFYKNILTGTLTHYTEPISFPYYTPALDHNDVYINGVNEFYYKNALQISATNSSKPIIKDLKVTDQNVYMVRTDPNNTEFKVYINGVETQSIQNLNLESTFNNITIVKN